MDNNSAGFASGLELSASPNYLGDPMVVDGILRNTALNALKRKVSVEPELAARLNAMDCECWATVFLGEDLTYIPMFWNSAGQIDKFVAEQLGWNDRSAEAVMQRMFAQFIEDIYSLVDYACTADVPRGNWEWQVQGTLETYRNLLLGIPCEVDMHTA